MLRNRGSGSSTGRLALVKRGSGTLILVGTNSGGYTGGLTVEGGILDYSLGTLPNCDYTINGGTLEMGSAAATIGKFTITGGKLNSLYASGVLTSSSDYDVRAGEVNAVLAGAVGLTKTGAGTAVLSAINTYTGPTLIQEGTLALPFNSETYIAASIANSPLIQISAGAALDVSDPSAPFTIAVNQTLQGSGTVLGNVTLLGYNTNSSLGAGNAASGGTLTLSQGLITDADAQVSLHLSPDATGTNNDRIAVTGVLTLPVSGQLNLGVHALGNTLDTTPGRKYTLMTYGSTDGGYLAANLAIVNNTRYTVTPDFSVFGQINLGFSGTGPLDLTWSGGDASYPNNWDLKSTANWNNNTQLFYEMDNVTFDDSSTVTDVLLQDVSYQPVAVFPGSITVNANQDYTFGGTGKISGPTGIVKSGTGTLTINTANDFAGTVSITNGTVRLGNSSALGSTDSGTSVSGTGTLDLAGFELPLGETVTISGTGYNGQGALVNSIGATTLKSLVLSGDAAIGGSANLNVGGNPGGLVGGGHALTKIGSNIVTLNDLGDTGLGGVVINEGRLELTGDTTLGDSTVTLDNLTAGTGGVAELSFNTSAVAHANNLVVGTNGGTIVTKNGTAYFLGSAGTLNGILNGKVSGGDTLVLGHQLTGPGGLSVNKDYVTTGTVMLTGSSGFTGGTVIYNGVLSLNCPTGKALSGDVTLYGSGNGKSLQLAADGQLDSSSIVHFVYGAGGGAMDFYLSGYDATVGGIDLSYAYSDSQAVIANSATDGSNSVLTVDNTADYKYRAVIRDTASGVSGTPGANTLALVKKGPGALTLAGAKSGQYSGGLTVEEGTLNYVGGLFPSVNGGPDDTVVNGHLPGGNYTITGGVLNIGTLSATIGTFQITDGLVEADDLAPGTLTSNAAFDIQGGTVEANLAGTIDAVGLNKTGAGTATLEGALLYAGDTTVYEGILNATAIDTPAATVMVAGGATLNAPSIVADTLTIGGTPVAVNGAVPEPGALVLLILAGLTLAGIAAAANSGEEDPGGGRPTDARPPVELEYT